MARKIKMTLENGKSVTITTPARTALPASTLERIRLMWQRYPNALPDWELRISASTPIGAGYGRSLRAAILGLPYKNARRISDDPQSFTFEDFNDPSAIKPYGGPKNQR